MKEKDKWLPPLFMNDGGQPVPEPEPEPELEPEPEPGAEPESEPELEPPAPGGVKPDVDEFGVPYKNRAKEYERKWKEVETKLQDKIRELEAGGKQDEADDLEAFLKEREDSEMPLTNADIRRLIDAIGIRVTRSVAKTIGPIVASQTVAEAQIDRIKTQDGFEPKAESILRAKLRQVPAVNLVSDPEGVSNAIYDMALGQLAREGKLGTRSKQPKRTPPPGAPPVESPGTPPAQRGKKPFTEREKTEAERMNISPQDYRAIQERRDKKRKEREAK